MTQVDDRGTTQILQRLQESDWRIIEIDKKIRGLEDKKGTFEKGMKNLKRMIWKRLAGAQIPKNLELIKNEKSVTLKEN